MFSVTASGSTAAQKSAHLERLAQSPLRLTPVLAQRNDRTVAAGMVAVDEKTIEYVRGRPFSPEGAMFEQAAAALGPLPYERYLFLVHLSDRRRGGRGVSWKD
mgnify:CR=1 FL=1